MAVGVCSLVSYCHLCLVDISHAIFLGVDAGAGSLVDTDDS